MHLPEGKFKIHANRDPFLPINVNALNVESGKILTYESADELIADPDQQPPAPRHLNAGAKDGIVSLNWNAVQVSDLEGYLIFHNLSNDTTILALNQGVPLKDSNFIDTVFVDSNEWVKTTYEYRIKAIDETQELSAFLNTAVIGVEPPNIPAKPEPANKSMDIPNNPLLTWRPVEDFGGNNVTYDVYMGPHVNAMEKIAQNVNTASYQLSDLQYKTLHYWRVAAHANGDTILGEIWSFTTEEPLFSDLIGFWPMDEGQDTIVNDMSGRGNHGTLFGKPEWADGVFGSALSFGSQNAYMMVPANNDINIDQGTISFWVNTDGCGETGMGDHEFCGMFSKKRAYGVFLRTSANSLRLFDWVQLEET